MRAGLRLGEALARCPPLRLVPPDPAGVADEWERLLGAAGGHRRGRRARPPRARVVRRAGPAHPARRQPGGRHRRGAARARHPGADRGGALALRGAGRLQRRPRAPGGARAVRRRGAARLPRAAAGARCSACARRRRRCRRCSSASACARSASWRRCRAPRWRTASGRPGVRARGARPRAGHAVAPALGLRAPGGAPGAARVGVGRAARARARPADRPPAGAPRAPRAHMRSAVLSARLVEGGTWRVRVTFREALADPRRMRLVLAPRLADLPAPAEALRLRAEGLARRRPTSARCCPSPRRCAPRGCARRCARRARSRGRRRRCGSSPWTPTRACRSGGSR